MLVRSTVSRTMVGALAMAGILAAADTAWAQAAGSTAAPQTVVPTPLPPGAGADTPGGAARNGVIVPPAGAADSAINRGVPVPTVGTPVIPPPGSPGGNPTVVPK